MCVKLVEAQLWHFKLKCKYSDSWIEQPNKTMQCLGSSSRYRIHSLSKGPKGKAQVLGNRRGREEEMVAGAVAKKGAILINGTAIKVGTRLRWKSAAPDTKPENRAKLTCSLPEGAAIATTAVLRGDYLRRCKRDCTHFAVLSDGSQIPRFILAFV